MPYGIFVGKLIICSEYKNFFQALQKYQLSELRHRNILQSSCAYWRHWHQKASIKGVTSLVSQVSDQERMVPVSDLKNNRSSSTY